MPVRVAMALIIFMVIAYIGIVIVEKVETIDDAGIDSPPVVATVHTTIPTIAPTTTITAEFNQAMGDAFGWIPIIIVTVCAAMVLTLLFSVFGYEGSSTPTRTPAPKPSAPPAKQYVWEPAPEPEPLPEPTLDEMVQRDPEIREQKRDIGTIEAELARLRTERSQHLADLGRGKRVLLWFKRRRARTEA